MLVDQFCTVNTGHELDLRLVRCPIGLQPRISIRVTQNPRAQYNLIRGPRPCRYASHRERRLEGSRCASPRIGVVGATGAVGTVTLQLLAGRGYDDVRAFASARSAGSQLAYAGRGPRRGGDAETLGAGDLDLCLFSGRYVGKPPARPAGGGGRRCLRRQVVRLPPRRRLPARRAGGERHAEPSRLSVATASSPIRTAAPFRSRAS